MYQYPQRLFATRLSDKEILNKMKFGLLGYPVAHSKSPALFAAAYKHSPHTYELLEFPDLLKGLEAAVKGGYSGLNITAPYKEEVLSFVHNADSLTSEVAAANLLLFSQGGIKAFNTDYEGVKSSVADFVTPGIKALVTGCGGAGRAAALVLRDLGAEVVIANRDYKKASKYASRFGTAACPIEHVPQFAKSARIIIDTIPAETDIYGNTSFDGKLIFEANYRNPQLIDKCTAEGGKYLSGIVWLVNQAIPSFRLFTGENPDSEAMELLASLW